jgi:hypothetical protein
VAYAVGYESVPQFTPEYRRMLRTPPDRHVEVANEKMQVAGKIYDFAMLYTSPPR